MSGQNRRSFLGGVLALTVASVMPKLAFESLPTIYADGFHDDAPGLNAMMGGKPFHVEATDIVARDGRIFGGRFFLKKPLLLTISNFEMHSVTLLLDKDFPRDPGVVTVRGAKNGCIDLLQIKYADDPDNPEDELAVMRYSRGGYARRSAAPRDGRPAHKYKAIYP